MAGKKKSGTRELKEEKESLRYIITKKNIKGVEGFKVVQSVTEVKEGVRGIIYNDSTDDQLSLYLWLSQMQDKLQFIIYICEDIPPLHYSIFKGLGAEIYRDEDNLSDAETLEYYIQKYRTTLATTSNSQQDYNKLYSSLQDLLSGDKEKVMQLVQSPLWKRTVVNYLNGLQNALAVAEKASVDIIPLFNSANKYIQDIKAVQNSVEQELTSMTQTIADIYGQEGGGSAIYYPKYNIPLATTKVVYIRFFSHCPYLMTFIQTYMGYLKTYSRNSKLLLIFAPLPLTIKRFEGQAGKADGIKSIARISMDSLVTDFTRYNVFYTTTPKRAIMEKFFSYNADVYFVLDMLYGNELIGGHSVLKFNAVSGMSDVKRFDLNSNMTFFSITGVKGGYIIPYISEYCTATTETQRRTLYYEQCKELYARLNKELKVM